MFKNTISVSIIGEDGGQQAVYQETMAGPVKEVSVSVLEEQIPELGLLSLLKPSNQTIKYRAREFNYRAEKDILAMLDTAPSILLTSDCSFERELGKRILRYKEITLTEM